MRRVYPRILVLVFNFPCPPFPLLPRCQAHDPASTHSARRNRHILEVAVRVEQAPVRLDAAVDPTSDVSQRSPNCIMGRIDLLLPWLVERLEVEVLCPIGVRLAHECVEEG
jgi:hypothetical protein